MKKILSMALAIVLTLTMFSAISMPTVEAKTKTKTIKATMYVGERFDLVYPLDYNLSMKISNKKVIKVNKKTGMLVAKKAGKATITCTYKYYGEGAKRPDITKKVKITVKNHPTVSGCEYTLYAYRYANGPAYDPFRIDCDVKLKYPKEFTAYRKVTFETYDISIEFDGKPIDYICWYDTYKVTDVEPGYTDDSGVWHDGSTTLVKIDTSIAPDNGPTVNGEDADVFGAVGYNSLGNVNASVGESVTENCVVSYEIGTVGAGCKVGDIIKVPVNKTITQEEANAYIYANYGRFKVTVVPIDVDYETRKSKNAPFDFDTYTQPLKLYD